MPSKDLKFDVVEVVLGLLGLLGEWTPEPVDEYPSDDEDDDADT